MCFGFSSSETYVSKTTSKTAPEASNSVSPFQFPTPLVYPFAHNCNNAHRSMTHPRQTTVWCQTTGLSPPAAAIAMPISHKLITQWRSPRDWQTPKLISMRPIEWARPSKQVELRIALVEGEVKLGKAGIRRQGSRWSGTFIAIRGKTWHFQLHRGRNGALENRKLLVIIKAKTWRLWRFSTAYTSQWEHEINALPPQHNSLESVALNCALTQLIKLPDLSEQECGTR